MDELNGHNVTMHIVCAADANYGAHAGITFSSVLNANVGEQIHLHLFSDGVTATDITRIAGMARRAGAQLSTYNTKQKLDRVSKLLTPKASHISRTAYGAVAICVGMISALSSGINLSDHAARSMI